MSESGARERPAFLMGGFGVVAAWHGALGPAVAHFDRWSRERPRLVRGLGHAGADRPAVPAVRRTEAGLIVAWCEEDGAWTAEVDLEALAVSAHAHRVSGARRVAFGGEVLFVVDERGILALRPGETEPRRVVSERREGFVVDAAGLRDEAVLVFTCPGDPEWGVVAIGPQGDPIVVRHALRAPCTGVRVRAVGGRAAVMLELQGGHVRCALLGPGAKVIERPHEVFPRGAGRFSTPDVVWTDDRWTALAHRPEDGALVVEPIGDKGDRFTLPRCSGAFAARFYHQRFYALEVEPRGDEVELRLWRSDADGGRPQQRVLEVALDDASARRSARDVRYAWRGVAHHIETSADYRTHATRPRIDRDGATLRVVDERGSLTLSARPMSDGRLTLRVASARGEAGPLEAAPSSLVRLARWVRARWSAEERRLAGARQAWAETLAAALGATLETVDVAGNTVVLRIVLDALPDPERLERWLRRLRDEQTRGAPGRLADPG